MKLLEKLGFKDSTKNKVDKSIESGNEDYLLVYPKSVAVTLIRNLLRCLWKKENFLLLS